MTLLLWDAPEKARTPRQNAEHYGFEDGPTGGYVPNMSDEDKGRWKAKITGQKRGTLQVEIRRSFGATLLLIVVCLKGGYTYKSYEPKPDNGRFHGYATNGVNIHVAMNGGLQMTFAQFEELHAVVAEAKVKLEQLDAAARWDDEDRL